MTRTLAAVLILGLAACSDEAPKPPPAPAKPVAKAPATQAPETKAPEAKAPLAKAPEAPKPDPDKELAARVKRALQDEARVQAAAIDVTSAGGTVTLWGTAASDAERRRAAQVAAKVDGVKSVDNKLAVVKGS